MAKKSKNKKTKSHNHDTQAHAPVNGLVIGTDTTRLINISTQEGILHLDYTIFCPEFKYDPDDVFNKSTLDKITRTHQANKAFDLYEDGLHNMFGDNLYDMGFRADQAQHGITFHFRAQQDDESHDDFWQPSAPRMPELISVSAVDAVIEKHISFEEANDFIADGRDERLDSLLYFMHMHHIIAPQNTRFGNSYNFQTIMMGIDNLTHDAGRHVVFEHRINAINRIREKDRTPTPYVPTHKFINTATAVAQNLSHQCRTFMDVNKQSSAVINTSAISNFIREGRNTYSPKQTNTFAKIHHQQAMYNYKPRYQQKRFYS